MNFGLNKHTTDTFCNVFRKYPEIQAAIIYGSRAKGNYREGSDIDITLKGEGLSDEICSKVWLDLDELNTPYLIDLSVYDKLTSDSLIEHIDRVGKVLYQK